MKNPLMIPQVLAPLYNQESAAAADYDTSFQVLTSLVILLFVVIGVLSMNIIRRRRAEKALRESEEKYRKLVETAHEGVLAVDPNFNITFANRRLADLLGYDPSEMTGRSVTAFIHPDEMPDHHRRVEDRKHRRSGSYERRFMKRNGETLVMHVSAQPLFDDRDSFGGAFIMVTDVTQQKQMEEALGEAQSLLITALDQSLAGIIIADAPSAKIRLINRAAEDILLQPREELLTYSLAHPSSRKYRCFRPDGVEYLENELPLTQAVLHGKSIENVEIRVTRADGSDRWILLSASPIRNFQEVIVAGFIVFSDITIQKQYQGDLQRAAKLESVGLLAGGIAHDFNNLLSAIVGNAGALKILISRGDRERSEKCLSEIENAAMRARDLTQQLLTFSRGGSPVMSVIALEPVLRESAGFALTGSHNRCNLEIGNLWPVIADGGQISQVVHNILLNADQAMPEPGSISLKAENVVIEEEVTGALPLQPGPYVCVTVEDQGIGIATEMLGKIFDPFFTTKQKGSGLGLASVYSIIKSHNGYVTVASVPGHGSIFTFYLPAQPDAVPADWKSNLSDAGPVKLRILVMDDELLVRNMLDEALRNIGHSVVAVPDGESAILEYEKAEGRGEPFDAVILDLTVPGGMGGRETIRVLKEKFPDIKAVASSGYTTDPVMADFRKYGFSGRLAKPYRIDELKKALSDALNHVGDRPVGRRAGRTRSGKPS